jgi:mono/diheme cytochrome c family protein
MTYQPMTHQPTKNRSMNAASTAYLLAALVAAAATAPASAAAPPTATTTAANAEGNDAHARGKYLVTVAGCNDCHTPLTMGPDGPHADMTRMLSGHPQDAALPPPPLPEGPWIVSAAATNTAWSGPWGVSFTANLTPHPDTGLGRWTLRNFVDTIRSGRHLGRGRPILPPMPIPMYRHFTDEDLQAIYLYLQSIPPIDNRVPEPLPPAAAAAGAG